MISTEAMPAIARDVGGPSRQAVFAGDLADPGTRLISRLVLALVLAAIAVLIPGEANRFLDAPLEWSDLFTTPRRFRGLIAAGPPRTREAPANARASLPI